MLTYLKDLVKFLFFEHSVFEVDCDFLLLLRKHHASLSRVVFKLVGTKSVHCVEASHDWHIGVSELTFHEELRVFAALRSQLDLALVKRLKASRELRLRLISIESATGMLTLSLNHACVRTRSKCWLSVHLGRTLVLQRLVPSTCQVLIVRGLPPLVERILSPSCIFTWLNSLQPTADVALRPRQNLFTILLKNAWQFYRSLSFRTSFLLQSTRRLLQMNARYST